MGFPGLGVFGQELLEHFLVPEHLGERRLQLHAQLARLNKAVSEVNQGGSDPDRNQGQGWEVLADNQGQGWEVLESHCFRARHQLRFHPPAVNSCRLPSLAY